MENTKVLNKGLFKEAFNVISANVALNLSLIIYAMHDYFNFFGTTEALFFTIFIFYGLAATGYYVLCMKNSDAYELPTTATKLVSLIFYASIASAVFFAFKIYVHEPMQYFMAFLACSIIGSFIKDVTVFSVYLHEKSNKTFDLLDITSWLSIMCLLYLLHEYILSNISLSILVVVTIAVFVVNVIYQQIKGIFLGFYCLRGAATVGIFSFTILEFMNIFIFIVISRGLFLMELDFELVLLPMSLYLYLTNKLVFKLGCSN